MGERAAAERANWIAGASLLVSAIALGIAGVVGWNQLQAQDRASAARPVILSSGVANTWWGAGTGGTTPGTDLACDVSVRLWNGGGAQGTLAGIGATVRFGTQMFRLADKGVAGEPYSDYQLLVNQVTYSGVMSALEPTVDAGPFHDFTAFGPGDRRIVAPVTVQSNDTWDAVVRVSLTVKLPEEAFDRVQVPGGPNPSDTWTPLTVTVDATFAPSVTTTGDAVPCLSVRASSVTS